MFWNYAQFFVLSLLGFQITQPGDKSLFGQNAPISFPMIAWLIVIGCASHG